MSAGHTFVLGNDHCQGARWTARENLSQRVDKQPGQKRRKGDRCIIGLLESSVSRVLTRTPARSLVATLVVAGAALSACASSGRRPTPSVPAVDRVGTTMFPGSQRRPVPELAGTTITGATLRVNRLTGHGVVVLNVWASWCAPCRAESRALGALSTRLAPEGVRFVGIDEQDSPARARAFAARAGVRYPSLSDRDGRLLAQLTELPSSGIPSTLVLDRSGKIAGRIVGAVHGASLSRLISRIDSGH